MRALVTGGGGFLGAAITRQLLERGDDVTILARGRYPEIEALGARAIQGDLQKPETWRGALAGIDTVFHTAAKTGVWGPKEAFFGPNTEGTLNLLAAAQAAGAARFIYTSSPSATFDGGDAEAATEADCPYPDAFEAHYPASKAAAEAAVLAHTGPMATCALRPHLIWGPGDPHLIPRLIERRRQGRLMRVGAGTNKVGITYIDNAAASHLQAAAALAPGSACDGKAYFITDDQPVDLWPWIDALLTAVGEQPVERNISEQGARRLGRFLEWIWGVFRLSGEPPMTRFVAGQLARSHWYDLTAAREDFGFHPVIDPTQAWQRTVDAFRDFDGQPR